VAAVGADCHGIAADSAGFVWTACGELGVVRFDANDLSRFNYVPGSGPSSKGIAVDADGKIWAINISHNYATVITPGPTLTDATAMTQVAPGLVTPYTYSDMTGAQLRLVTAPRGHYRRVFEGCPTDGRFEPTEWTRLTYTTEVPAGTRVVWAARTAPSREALADAAFVDIAEVPGTDPPIDLAAALAGAGLSQQPFLEVEIRLSAERQSTTEVITPRVGSVELTVRCEPIVN
jgi:hypothetical protein